MNYKIYSDQTFQNLYREERNKGSQLPNADADFEALNNALKRYGAYEVEEGDNQ